MRRAVPLLCFVIATFAFMPRALLGQGAYGSVDMVETGAPYRDAIGRPPDVASPIQTDQVEQLPGVVKFFEELRDGHWQTWDRRVAGGTPTGIFPMGGLLSPFSVGFLFLPAWYAIGLKVALTLLFCQCATYLLLRRLGIGVVVATLGAIAYTFCGTNLVLILRLTAPFVLPALLWAGHRLVERPDVRRTFVLAAFVAWCWFEGFPSGFVYCVYATAAWCAWLALRRRPFRLRALLSTGVAFGLGGLLSMVSLWPLVSEIVARNALEHRPVIPLPSIQQFGLFIPRALGVYPDGAYWTERNPMESTNHAGLLVIAAAVAGLVLVAAGRLRLRDHAAATWTFFTVAGAGVLVICYHEVPVLFDLVTNLPGIADNPITRTRFLVNLALVVLAAITLDAWWSDSDGERPSRLVRLLSAGALITAFVSMAIVATDFLQGARTAAEGDEIRTSFLRHAGLVVVALALAAAVRYRRRLAMPVGAALAVLLFVTLALPFQNFTSTSPRNDFYTEQAGHVALRKATGAQYRFAATGVANLYPNSAQLLDLVDLRGQTIFPPAFKRLVEAASPLAYFRDPLKMIMPLEEWNLASPVYDDLALGYFVLGTDEQPIGREVSNDGPRFTWARAAALPIQERRAPGPITALSVPVRVARGCETGSLQLRLSAGGRLLDESTRPVADARGAYLPFAVTGDALARGDAYRLELRAPARCALEVGTTDGVRLATQVLGPDDRLPLRLVATEQGWIYQRPTALPLVRATTRWQSYATQPDALAAIVSRPPADRGVAAIVGDAGSSTTAGAAEVRDVRWADESVRFRTRADRRALAVVAQNADERWRATVDGRPAEIVSVDGALAGVFVPEGDHDVRLAYRPTHFYLGAAVSVATLLAMLIVLAIVARRARPTR